MNCKPGDLAIVVRCPGAECNVGAIRTVVEASEGWFGPGWVLDPPLPNGHDCIYDHFLRPIRPSEGDDETLAWAGNPEQVTA